MSTGYPYLDKMPAAKCPEGCVVRKGETLGVVQREAGDDGEQWAIAFLGSGIRESGNGAPEDDEFGEIGWRHALDHPRGFSYVWLAIEHHMAHSMSPGVKRALRAAGMKYGEWLPIRHRWLARETTDADRDTAARMFAAVPR